MAKTAPHRSRLALDVPPDLRRRARIAAARFDLTLQEYARRALARQVTEDSQTALSGADDPVLSARWANEADAVYDKL
ncbi:MAG: hypothetical protein AABZ30_12525 [Myxococcota bacterium]